MTLTRQQRRDRAFRRCAYALFAALAAAGVRVASDYIGFYGLGVIATLAVGGCIVYANVALCMFWIGFFVSDSWVNDWLD
jgi:hypothetical protein